MEPIHLVMMHALTLKADQFWPLTFVLVYTGNQLAQNEPDYRTATNHSVLDHPKTEVY